MVIPNQSLVQSLVHTSNSQDTPEQGKFLLCYMIKYILDIVYELEPIVRIGQEPENTCICTQTSHSKSITCPVTSLDPQFLSKL